MTEKQHQKCQSDAKLLLATVNNNIHSFSMYGYVASKFFPLVLLEYCELGDILHYVTDNGEHLMVRNFHNSFNTFF